MPRRVSVAPLGGLLDLHGAERRVRAGEVDVSGDELLTARAGSGRIVGQVLPGAQLRPDLVEQRDSVLLGRRTLGGQGVPTGTSLRSGRRPHGTAHRRGVVVAAA